MLIHPDGKVEGSVSECIEYQNKISTKKPVIRAHDKPKLQTKYVGKFKGYAKIISKQSDTISERFSRVLSSYNKGSSATAALKAEFGYASYLSDFKDYAKKHGVIVSNMRGKCKSKQVDAKGHKPYMHRPRPMTDLIEIGKKEDIADGL